nr:hypothetical protein [Nitrosospira briensis]
MKVEEAVFVLHCFQKKSKSGITTPKEIAAERFPGWKIPEGWH